MTAVFTSITLSYLAKARVLARSVKRHNPDYRFYLVLAEPAPPWLAEGVSSGREPFDRLVTIDDLPIANKPAWLFGLDVVEACTGVKGPALKLLQEKFAEEQVIYLDPDIAVFHSLEPIAEMLREHSIVLTPHCSNAETEIKAIILNEISSLAHGVFNLGFLAVASDAEGRRLAGWWSHRLYHFCHDDIPRGLFTDQRWMDLVPSQFDRVKILRDPAYNVASWNITQRHVGGSVPDGLLCDGRPLCFYHFSGMNSNTPNRMHRNFVPENKTLAELVRWYQTECERQAEREFRGSRWHFSQYEDGSPITRPQRLWYRSDPQLQSRFPQPFAVGAGTYYHWLTTEGPGLDEIEKVFPQTIESLQAAASRLRQIVCSRPYKVYAKIRRLVRAA
jgi:hypothetical protein